MIVSSVSSRLSNTNSNIPQRSRETSFGSATSMVSRASQKASRFLPSFALLGTLLVIPVVAGCDKTAEGDPTPIVNPGDDDTAQPISPADEAQEIQNDIYKELLQINTANFESNPESAQRTISNEPSIVQTVPLDSVPAELNVLPGDVIGCKYTDNFGNVVTQNLAAKTNDALIYDYQRITTSGKIHEGELTSTLSSDGTGANQVYYIDGEFDNAIQLTPFVGENIVDVNWLYENGDIANADFGIQYPDAVNTNLVHWNTTPGCDGSASKCTKNDFASFDYSSITMVK